jgi:hypothetical protein
MTARKTGPHLKRGRKPKPKPEKRSRGRPQVPLREHPDRYVVARFDVADTWLKDVMKGNRLRASAVNGMSMRQHRLSATDVRKTADKLRTMARRYQKPDDMKWRRDIAMAVGYAMLGAASGGEPEQGRMDLIMEYAAKAGEVEWMRREVLPLMGMRPSGSLLDLTVHDRLPSLALNVVMVGWTSEIMEWMAARAAREERSDGTFPN